MKIQTEQGQKLEVSDTASPHDIDDILHHFGQSSPSIPKTIFDQGMQGATFSLADEVTDPIGAGIASVATGKNYFDVLKQARDSTSQDLSNEMHDHPFISVGSQLAGGLASGGIVGDLAKGTVAGNMLRSGQVAKGAGYADRATNLAANMGKGAIKGAVAGATYGFGSGEDGNKLETAKNYGELGAGVGALFPVAEGAVSAVKNAFTPSVSQGVQDAAELAQKHSVPLSLDQLSDSHARKYIAATSGQVPFSGGPEFATKQQGAFNSAILKTIGESGDTITPDIVSNAYDNIGQKFDNVLAGKTLQVTPQDSNKFGDILKNASGSLANDKVNAIKNVIDDFNKNVAPDGTIPGEVIGDIRSTITKQMRRADPGIKEYLGDVLDNIMDISTEGNPAAKAQLTEAKYQYKNLKTIEPLIAKATDGNISPALLKNRVIQNYGAKAMATGNAGDLGELSKVGDLIKKKVGDSGTAQRAASMALLATPGAIIGGYETPGGIGKKAMGAAAGAGATVLAAKGYQSYNNSEKLAEMAMKLTPKEISRLPPATAMAVLAAKRANQ